MLTKDELQWLEDREMPINEYNYSYYCRYCRHYVDDCTHGLGFRRIELCPTSTSKASYKDAAEFEALVAAKVADSCWHQYVKWETPIKPNLSLFQRSKDRLKHARIEVEKEMDDLVKI